MNRSGSDLLLSNWIVAFKNVFFLGILQPLLCDGQISPEEYPVQSTFYNKKKNRPASSISEVLEEMERQKREKGKIMIT